jgi:phosphate transport system permease protein
MTDIPNKTPTNGVQGSNSALRNAKRRQRAERRFRFYGFAGVVFALGCLAILLTSLTARGVTAITHSKIQLEIFFDETVIDPNGTRDEDVMSRADYQGLVKSTLRELFPDANSRRDKKALYKLVSSQAGFSLRDMVLKDPNIIGDKRLIWVIAGDDVDVFRKQISANNGSLNKKQISWVRDLEAKGLIENQFNSQFFLSGDSREPEMAGILGAVMGSFLTLLVCFVASFPVGVLAAVYLEEFAPKNKISHIIEVNINNLAAVPSIVFGLLGLALLLNVFGLPRSAPIAGGLVLALMTLPTIIIATRAALKAVPPSIREAAYGLGASPMQVTFHHVVPLSMPGILTGSIIGMSQALGETAPLLLIGMVAFIVDIPTSFVDPATTLPVQIFIWADSPERGFMEKTAAAILVLLAFLLCMNLLAVILRKKFERKY